MDVSKFNEKLNKIDGQIYVMEEVVTPKDGVYEGELAHDNVNLTTLNIYTGSKLTGDKINTYTTSTPSLTPWKTVIKIYSNVTPLYISYETSGDTVEAEDINNVQDAIVDTEKALNNEVDRAINAENVLTSNLNTEINRATNAEKVLENNLNGETLRAKAAENTITNTINSNKPTWDDKYTKNEIDNKISAVITGQDSKEHVSTFADIAKTYPNPDKGWTVSVDADDVTYKYNGTEWIAISINAIPLATKDVDGKMSKQDKIDHDDMNSKKHTHINKGILDVITQSLLDTWNSAYCHISDTVKHITSTERINWNTAYNNNHTHGNKSVIDTITQALIDTWNSAYTHINDAVRHITNDERTSWNNGVTTANSANAKIDGLQIGGRNLLRYSGKGYYSGGVGFQQKVITTVDGKECMSFTGYDNILYLNSNDLPNMQVGKYYSFSFYAKASENLNLNSVYLTPSNNNFISNTQITTEWKRFNFSFVAQGNVAFRIHMYPIINNGDGTYKTFYLADWKLEEGNKATDWTPAPEDIQADLDSKSNINHTHDDRYYTETESDNKFATKGEISKAGYGDMMKSVYDTNNDGVVDNADKLDGKHASDFMPTSGTGTAITNLMFNTSQRGKAIYNGNWGSLNYWGIGDGTGAQVKIGTTDINGNFVSGDLQLVLGSSNKVVATVDQTVKKGCTWNELEGV